MEYSVFVLLTFNRLDEFPKLCSVYSTFLVPCQWSQTSVKACFAYRSDSSKALLQVGDDLIIIAIHNIFIAITVVADVFTYSC